MRFWDSSALVPLCLTQPLSARVRGWYRADPAMAVWWSSPVECASAFARLRRDQVLDVDEESTALNRLRQLQASWFEVLPGDVVRDQAQRLLRVHPLRAADALQLAAALEWAGVPSTGEFITFDDRLKAAARLEGFLTP